MCAYGGARKHGACMRRNFALDRGPRASKSRPMRITGGRARGIPIGSGKGPGLRPATDRAREAVFSSLGARVAGARVLDLFAGTGAYGLDALSRGAAEAVFVEKHPRTAALIRDNLAALARSLGAAPVATVRATDALVPLPGARFDLIFADPPYEAIRTLAPALFDFAAAHLAIDNDAEARFIFEMPGELELRDPRFELTRRLGHGRGQPTLCIYALSGAQAPTNQLTTAS